MMECFIFRGFSRADHSINVSLIVDVDSSDIMRNDVRARVTEKIAGPGYCFPTSQTVIRPVPDAAKNKLFMSDAELYAAAPELDYRKRKRRTKTEKADAFAAQLQQWGGKPAASIEPPAPKSSSVATGVSYIFRGFDYTGDDERGYTISKDGVELAGPLPTKAAVMAWVDEAKRLEMTKAREAKPASSIEPPALKPRKPPLTPPQPVQSAPAVKPRKLPLKPDAAITLLEYGTLDDAFKYLNAKLFDGALPDLLIVFSRRAHSRGHYAAGRWSGRANDSGTDELSLNPDTFLERTDEQIVSTLLHEMVHHWQTKFGNPPKRTYHNREWARKMKSLGLMPSTTGAPGGKETGQSCSHYIIPGGAYQQAFKALADTGWKLNLQSAIRAGGSKARPSKVKFSCECGQNAWGKPDLEINCAICNRAMTSEQDGSYAQQAAE